MRNRSGGNARQASLGAGGRGLVSIRQILSVSRDSFKGPPMVARMTEPVQGGLVACREIKPRRQGAMGTRERRTQGARIAALLTRPRTYDRAAQCVLGAAV